MKEKTYRVALGGVLSALAAVFMMMGGIFPFAQFCGPAMACICVMIFLVECGPKWAFFMYLAVSGVALLVSPDLESVLLFVCFLGWYPLLKMLLETKVRSRALQLVLKLAAMAVCVGLMYYALLKIFPVAALVEEFAGYGAGFLVLLILMASVAFLLIDVCLSRMAVLYLRKFREKLVGSR